MNSKKLLLRTVLIMQFLFRKYHAWRKARFKRAKIRDGLSGKYAGRSTKYGNERNFVGWRKYRKFGHFIK